MDSLHAIMAYSVPAPHRHSRGSDLLLSSQESLLRILYIWAIRHPGSGYVQGINDLSTPFLVVFLSTFVDDITACNLAELPPGIMQVLPHLESTRGFTRVLRKSG